MFSDLQRITEARLGTKVTQVVAVLPYLPRHLDLDLKDALEHAGIKRISGRRGIFEKNEKYPYGGVSIGHGICKNREDKKSCEAEEKAMTGEQTLSITYTNRSLQVESLLVYDAEHVVRGYSNNFRYLGSQPFNLDKEKEKSDISTKISKENLKQGRIMQIKSSGWGLGKRKFQRLVLMGESAEDKDFLSALWIALGELESLGFLDGSAGDLYSALQTPGFSSLYTGARGAAQLAIRWQEKRNATFIVHTKSNKPTTEAISIPEAAPVVCSIVQVAYGPQDSERVIMNDNISKLNVDVNFVVRALWRMPPTYLHRSWSMEIHDCPGHPRKLYGFVNGSKYWTQIIRNSQFDSRVSWKDGATSEEVAYNRHEHSMPRTRIQTIDHLIRKLNLNPHWVQRCVERFNLSPFDEEWSIHAVKVPGRASELRFVMGETAQRIVETIEDYPQVGKIAWGGIEPNADGVLVTIFPGSEDFGDDLTTKILKDNFHTHSPRESSWEVWARMADFGTDRGTLAPLWVFFNGKFAFMRSRP